MVDKNPLRGAVIIDLDRARTIKFNHYARAVFEHDYGASFLKCFFRIIKSFDELSDLIGVNEELKNELEELKDRAKKVDGEFLMSHDLMLLLKAGLMHEDSNITAQRAADLIDYAPGDSWVQKTIYVFSKVFEAIMWSQEKLSDEQLDTLKKTQETIKVTSRNSPISNDGGI